jgi:hypothetical protein
MMIRSAVSCRGITQGFGMGGVRSHFGTGVGGID